MANDRKRSAVWMYFTQLSGQFKAKCNTCGNVYSFTGGSTSNLALHIRKKHPSLAESLPSRNSKGNGKGRVKSSVVGPTVGLTVNDDVGGEISADVASAIAVSGSGLTTDLHLDGPSTSSAGMSSMSSAVAVQHSATGRCANRSQSSLTTYVTRPASVARQKRLNNMLLKMIVRDFQPFSVVEDGGFRDFVTALDPSFTIPTRQMLAKDMLTANYKDAVDKVKALLAQTEAVCLTTDAWTSICTESYIAVTAHYVNSNMTLGSCLLECVKYGERHTADNLCTDLKRVEIGRAHV